MKNIIFDTLRSLWQLSGFVLFSKRPEVLFNYPQHFNRSMSGENPFFQPLVAACLNSGLRVCLIEEPDFGTDKPRNHKALKFDFLFWHVIILRKIYLKIKPNSSQDETDKFAAKFVDFISFGKFRAKAIITISNSNIRFWSSLNKNAKVFDMQHGIIYKNHPGYFDADGGLYDVMKRPNVNVLFWGKGYEDNFIRGDEEALAGRTHVVGYPVVVDGEHRHREGPVDNSAKRSVVVSLQFTNSLSAHGLEDMKNALARFLDKTSEMPVKVLLKHHPRYNNCISIDDLLQGYHNVELTDLPLCDLLDKTLLHITFNSTTAFEFAQFGIPTYFIPCDGIPATGSLFYKEYGYPLYASDSIADVFARLTSSDNYKTDSDIVYRWYLRFYSPFDETEFLKNIK